MEEDLKWKSEISQCSQQSSVLNPYELFVNPVSIYLQNFTNIVFFSSLPTLIYSNLLWVSRCRTNLISLRKQPTFGDATTGFPAKWRLRNEPRNSILMTCHYQDLGSASDWLNQISQPITSTAQIWVVTRHQYGIPALVSQKSFDGEASGPNVGCFLRL